MLSLLVHPTDDVRTRRLTTTELYAPGPVLGVENPEVIYMDASIVMWVDGDYLDRDREEFNALATFLAREHDFTFPSLRGPVLLGALRSDGAHDNFTTVEAATMSRRLRTLANN